MKITPHENFFLINTENNSNIFFVKNVLFYSSEFVKIPLLRRNKTIIITGDYNINIGDLPYIPNGMMQFEHIGVKVTKENISTFKSLNAKKIIASNSPELTPHHLISENDLKFIIKKWNALTELPSGILKQKLECSKIQCNGECGECEHAELTTKTINNEVVINWDNTISHSYSIKPTEDTIVIDDITQKINEGQDAKQIISDMISDGLKSGKYTTNEGKDEHGNPITLITTQQDELLNQCNKDKIEEIDIMKFLSKTTPAMMGIIVSKLNEVIRISNKIK
jgi:hypothetical protein